MSPVILVPAPEDDTDDADAADGTTHHETPAHPGSRCAEIRLESGDLVIYDGDASDAWLQSSVAVEIAALH